MGPDQYLFITPVWGEAYVERFVKVCLPSQLSAGNLGAIPSEKGRFLIYTLREHARTITRSPAFRLLKSMMPVAVKSLDDLPDPRLSKNPHELQTAAYMRGIRAGEGKETAFVFLTPDILVGDGTYRNMMRLAEDGKRIHLVAGIRMLTEGAVSCVAQHWREGRPDVAIPSRDLVRACLDNLHPISVAHIVNDGKVLAPQHLYWRVADHGLLARGFHLHPLFVWPRSSDAVIRNTLDDEYVSRACPDRSDWHTVTDSDEICVIEFSDRQHKSGMIAAEPLTDRTWENFLRHGTTEDHRNHVLHRIMFHAQNVAIDEWGPAAAASDELVGRYLDLFVHGVPVLCEATTMPLVVPASVPETRRRMRRLLRFLALPYRVANRVINFKLYRYVDRLNEQLKVQQIQLDQCVAQITLVSKMVEEHVGRLKNLEAEVYEATARVAREAEARQRLEMRFRRAG